MENLPVTPRENWIRMLRHERTFWMPTFGDTQMILPNIIPDVVARAIIAEVETVPPEQYGGKDMYGINWVYVPQVHGSMEDPNEPHLFEDVSEWREKVKFPDMDAWDWEGASKRNYEKYLDPNKFRMGWIYTGMFERLISFMGFENAAMALIDEDSEEDLHALLDAIADTEIELIRRYKKYFDIDCIYFHDDWGSQRSPFFSLNVVRRTLVPHIKRVVDFCHENGIFFELHSCGMIEDLVPAMIEAGVDCWAGQVMNDRVKLFNLYGDKIAIGYTISARDVEEGKKEIKAVMDQIRPSYGEKHLYLFDLFSPPEFIDYVHEISADPLAAS